METHLITIHNHLCDSLDQANVRTMWTQSQKAGSEMIQTTSMATLLRELSVKATSNPTCCKYKTC